MKIFLSWFESVCALVALILVSLFCYHIFPHKADRDAWDIITAIGTVAAVAVALWVAFHQTAEQRRTEKIRANLVAAQIFFPVTVVAAKAARLGKMWMAVEDVDPNPHDSEHYLTRLQELYLPYDLNVLQALAPLDGRCAYKLAGAIGHLEAAKGLLTAAGAAFHVPGKREERKQIVQALAFQLTECAQLLRSVSDICQKASLMLTSPYD